MIRGLFHFWKQPIFYKFDKPLTSDIIKEIIGELYDIGYCVVGLTTDLGPTNIALRKSLNIQTSSESCSFPHPRDNNLKVFLFCDVPHLLKLIRNNFIDSGFCYEENIFDKKVLEEILTLNKGDLRIPYKLEQKHIDVAGSERQRVFLLAQVFSNTTAEAIRWYGQNGFLNNQFYEECADFFKCVNDWFDLFNTKKKYGKTIASCAYGSKDLEKQNEILDKMTYYMENIEIQKHKSLLPFQKGIISNNIALKELLLYLKQKYSTNDFQVQYILTDGLNQDCLENFFFLHSRYGIRA